MAVLAAAAPAAVSVDGSPQQPPVNLCRSLQSALGLHTHPARSITHPDPSHTALQSSGLLVAR